MKKSYRENVSTLVHSSNSGKLALDDDTYGAELSCGRRIEILLGGRWICGHVEHAPVYPVEKSLSEIMQRKPNYEVSGYYFISDQGELCGLCVGMKARLPQ